MRALLFAAFCVCNVSCCTPSSHHLALARSKPHLNDIEQESARPLFKFELPKGEEAPSQVCPKTLDEGESCWKVAVDFQVMAQKDNILSEEQFAKILCIRL